MIKRLSPEGVLEEELVDRLVSLFWRLRRIPQFEAALFECKSHRWSEVQIDEYDSDIDADDDQADDAAEAAREKRVAIGNALLVLLQYDFTGKLSRYETSLHNQCAATFAQYQKLVAARSSAATPTPPSGEAGDRVRPLRPYQPGE
jgi:hypothetical protein